MSKWYEIAVTINRTYAVEIEDHETEEDAKKVLQDELCGDDYDLIDCFGPATEEHEVRNIQVLAYDKVCL